MHVHPTYLLGNKASYCSDCVRIGPCKVYRCTRRNCARNNTLAASGLLILNYTPPSWRSPEQNKARLGPQRALLSSLYCSLCALRVFVFAHTPAFALDYAIPSGVNGFASNLPEYCVFRENRFWALCDTYNSLKCTIPIYSLQSEWLFCTFCWIHLFYETV